MTPTETKKLYERACKSRRIEPQQEEAVMWHRTLKEFEGRDVEAALNAWDTDSAPDERNQPRGKWLPKPVELKPLVEAAKRRREAATQGPQDLLMWSCEKGHRASSFIAREKLAPAMRCRVCNTPMMCERTAA